MHDEIVRVKQSIDAIARNLKRGELKRGQLWGGADVIIVESLDEIADTSSQKTYRYVVTPHAREVSYVFKELYDAFVKEELIDISSKLEFC